MTTKRRTTQHNGGPIDYENLIERRPWVVERGRQYILSPDSDGFLCGLLVTNFLDGEVVGFYDGKILISKDGVNFRNCIFLDIEINRRDIGSMGNHLVEYNRNLVVNNRNFDECIQPNILRGFDGKTAFQRKYPFGTIHLLLGILQESGIINDLPDTAVSPLLFADGVGNNLFGYPENCLDWINYLKINQDGHILNKFLCKNDLNFYQIMQYLERFFAMRDRFNASGYFDGTNFVQGGNNKRTGHKIKITSGQNTQINLVRNGSNFDLHSTEAQRVQGFIRELARMMGWQYLDGQWNWKNFNLKILQKGMLSGESRTARMRLNNQTYKALFDRNPFSLAMTASNRIEYTIE
ncbi:hypothetical protein EPN90_03455 [Patescibacteria group bacterium]|nr:MAG: hypothetical protein EPN90_03455 [Patescibacteria group bacterium]